MMYVLYFGGYTYQTFSTQKLMNTGEVAGGKGENKERGETNRKEG